MRRAAALAAAAAALVAAPAASAQTDPLQALRDSCAARRSPDNARYRICTAPVASFDGTPLDVTLTLPAKRSARRLPVVVFLHGFLSHKGEYLSETREGVGPDRGAADSYKTVRWNNVWFASRGYAVVNYSARGHGSSGGEINLASRDVEVRDTQYLTGLLVDRGATLARVNRNRIGVIGGSYGGGQTWLLMTTRPSPGLGFGTWRSPAGRRLQLTAAVPMYTWSDLLYALVPSGRHRSSGVDSKTAAAPIGIPKQTLINGFLATAGGRLPSRAYGWLARTNAGEPYDAGDPVIEEARRELTAVRSAFYQDDYFTALARGKGFRRVPVFAAQGWTDPLFPAIEALRMYRRLNAASPRYPIQLYLGDFEHLTARAKVPDMRHYHVLAGRFLDHHLRGIGRPPPREVRAAVTNCDERRFGPVLRARTFDRLVAQHRTFDLGGPRQTASPGTANPLVDPVVLSQQRGRGCITTSAAPPASAATYRVPLTAPATLVGLPRLKIAYLATAPDFELNAHLWDVAPDGTRTLIDRGAYRGGPEQSGTIEYELFGNAWRLEPGHELELELLQDDSTFLRADNFASTVTVQDVELALDLAAP